MTTISTSPTTRTDFLFSLRNTSLFHSTNAIWNQLNLNHSWVIGSLNTLFRKSKAKTLKEWETYYFHSGEQRQQQLKRLSFRTQYLLNVLSLQRPSVHPEDRKLNTDYGRTQKDLDRIAEVFHDGLMKRGRMEFTPELIRDYVYVRVDHSLVDSVTTLTLLVGVFLWTKKDLAPN